MDSLTSQLNALSVSDGASNSPAKSNGLLLTAEERIAYKKGRDAVCDPIKCDEKKSASLEDWPGYCVPQECCVEDGISILVVNNPAVKKSDQVSEEELEKLDKEFKLLSSNPINVTHGRMKELALKYGFVTGKWLFHLKPKDSDAVWRRLTKALLEGKLPKVLLLKTPARDKTTPSPYSEVVKISALTQDFTNVVEVFDVEKSLRELGVKYDMFYKADIYSRVGIYARGKYNIRPSIHRSKGTIKLVH